MRILIFLLSILLPNILFAEQIKVLDNSSLLRASAECKHSCQIAVTLASDTIPSKLILTNLDGVQADVEAQQSEGVFIFPSISSGSWKIQSASPIKVLAVKISASN